MIFICSFLGSLSDDYRLTMTDKDVPIRPAKVLFGAISASFIVFAATNYISLDSRLLCLISYIAGLSGFAAIDKLKKTNIIDHLLKLTVNTEDNKKDRDSNWVSFFFINIFKSYV